MGRKIDWPIERFRDFGVRARAAYVAHRRFIRGIEGAKGIKARDVDRAIGVDYYLHLAILYGEDLLLRQHPDAEGRRIVFDPTKLSPDVGPPLPRKRLLARADWEAIGADARFVRDTISTLAVELYPVRDAKRVLRQLGAAERAHDRARCSLDSVCAMQHPDWDDFPNVFYGAPIAVPA